MNKVYKLRPTMLYSVTQSHCSIWSHDVFLQFAGLDNTEGEPRLLCYDCRSCKTLQLYFSESVHTVQKGFSKGFCHELTNLRLVHCSPDLLLFYTTGGSLARVSVPLLNVLFLTGLSLASQTLFPRVGGRGRKCGGEKGSGVSGP